MGRMARIGRELRGLDGIVAVLLVLARLAEHIASAPRPVRRAVLWVLLRAEAVARRSAGRYAFRMGLPTRPVVMPLDGDDHAAARTLAMALRMLALAIRNMLSRLHRRQFLTARRPGASDRADRRPRLPLSGILRMQVSPAGVPDTS